MGLFRKSTSQSAADTDRPTELDQDWFTAWADHIRAAVGNEQLRRQLQVSSDLDAFVYLLSAASGVIDHHCRDYVQRYLPADAQRIYAAYVASDEATPWGLVSLVVSLNEQQPREWEEFIIEDVKGRLGRFAEIAIDPSIVE